MNHDLETVKVHLYLYIILDHSNIVPLKLDKNQW